MSFSAHNINEDSGHTSGNLPHNQLAIDIFKGTWSCNLPDHAGVTTGGFAGTFDDSRILWAAGQLNGFCDDDVLELGPLEGGHAYMLERLGVNQVISIEGNPTAYLKCLIVKEILKLHKTQFLLGDFIPYLHLSSLRFHACIACGVLYHLTDPVEAILSISKCCEKLFIWTHYFDSNIISPQHPVRKRFLEAKEVQRRGETFTYHHYSYGHDKEHRAYCGGLSPHATWLSKIDLIKALVLAGFTIVAEKVEENPHGPAIWIAARKE